MPKCLANLTNKNINKTTFAKKLHKAPMLFCAFRHDILIRKIWCNMDFEFLRNLRRHIHKITSEKMQVELEKRKYVIKTYFKVNIKQCKPLYTSSKDKNH